jgi:hypothetical protein
LLVPALAHAGGRKRVVVLELEGPKAEKFHEDLVKLIKKSHTVVPLDKWNGTAEDLDASKVNEKNLKKVAKKLKIDAIISGKIDKRRDDYIIKLKLREGKTGEFVGQGIDTKADGPRITGKAQKDLKDELIDAISNVDVNRSTRGGGDDDEDEEDEDKPAKKKPMKKDDEDDEDEDQPVKKGFSRKDDDEEDEDKPVKKGFSRKNDDEDKRAKKKKTAKKDDEDDEEDEEDRPAKKGFSRKDNEEDDPAPKSAKKKRAAEDDEDEEDEDAPRKKVAARDDDEEDEEDEDEDGGSVEEDSEDEDSETSVSVLSPGERAVDAVIGLSFNARRMAFVSEPGLAAGPPPYKGVPVAGLLIDATVYPLAIGHKKKGMAKNFGATVMFDKVLKISSKAGTPPVSLPTSQSRYAFGVAFRYPVGKLTVGATLRYGRQNFTITPSGGVMPDIPNVNYTIIDPSVVMRYEATPKVLLNVNVGFMLLTNTGQIQNGDQYGPATVTGFEGEIGGDYLLTKNIFVRAAFKFETIGFKFRGGAIKTNTMYDADGGQDVFGARDSYLGGAATVGYLY